MNGTPWLSWLTRYFLCGQPQGVGRIYQQTFIDTYSKVAFANFIQ